MRCGRYRFAAICENEAHRCLFAAISEDLDGFDWLSHLVFDCNGEQVQTVLLAPIVSG